MPSSVVRTFSDADDYAAAIRGGTVEATVTGRGNFAAKNIRIDLQRLWMQRSSANLPRIYHVDAWGGRAVIGFRTQTGPPLLYGGRELQPSDLVRPSEGHSYNLQSSGSTCISGMSLSLEEMDSVGRTMAGHDLTPPRDTLIFTPPPAAMTKLQRLYAAAAHLAETAPEIIANLDAARGLEQALIEAMVYCFGNDEPREDSVAQRQHELIMRRFRRVVEESPDQPLYDAELCKAIGVSERTLRVCCQEQLGVGPKRYLQLRRLHLARRALREASADAVTVTEVAMRYGFWHLGRFAGEYQSLFGEPPSSTLHRPAE
jgi:AraC-like DNA-binding protein